MNDDPPPPEITVNLKTDAKTEGRAAEAAAIRRRWISMGEMLAVAAVIISALTLWNSWSERRDSAAVKSADAHRASAQAATLVLRADAGKRTLALEPVTAGQSVQRQRILFPAALGVAPAETTGEPRIEAGWFEGALKQAREAAHLPDNSRGDERLPVAIATRFLVDGVAHEDVALYDIGYTISGRLLSGHSVTLRGLSLVAHVRAASAQARLDARWTAMLRAKGAAAK